MRKKNTIDDDILPNISSEDEDENVDVQESLSQTSFNSQSFFQEESPVQSRKRLVKRPEAETPVATVLSGNRRGFLASLKSSTSTQEDELQQLNKKLSDNAWLKRVLDHLRPLSNSVQAQSLEEEFKKIKQQWGFTGRYESVESEVTDCTTCGHQHVAALFEILNIETRNITDTGSSCIKQFCALGKNEQLLPREQSLSIIKQAIDDADHERLTYRNEIRKFFV